MRFSAWCQLLITAKTNNAYLFIKKHIHKLYHKKISFFDVDLKFIIYFS